MPSLSLPIADAKVDCRGCTACCESGAAIFLTEHDDPTRYEVRMQHAAPIIAQRPNGDCWYLQRGKGCTIWEDRPLICRAFSCVDHYRALQARGMSDKRMVRERQIDRKTQRAALRRIEEHPEKMQEASWPT